MGKRREALNEERMRLNENFWKLAERLKQEGASSLPAEVTKPDDFLEPNKTESAPSPPTQSPVTLAGLLPAVRDGAPRLLPLARLVSAVAEAAERYPYQLSFLMLLTWMRW